MSPTPPEFQRFMFSLHAADDTAQDLELKINALRSRIDKVVGQVTIESPPEPMHADLQILDYVLRLNPTQVELERLGHAAVRIAPLRAELVALESQMAMVTMVRENPKALAALFGEFEGDQLDPDMFNPS